MHVRRTMDAQDALPTSRQDSSHKSGDLIDAKHSHATEEQLATQPQKETVGDEQYHKPPRSEQTTLSTQLTEKLPVPSDPTTKKDISIASASIASSILLRRGDSDKNQIQESSQHTGQTVITAANLDPTTTVPNLPFAMQGLEASKEEGEEEELYEERFDSDTSDPTDRATIADSFESLTDSYDYGYDSDQVSSASTSAAPSVRDFLYENGWRYHRYREGSYNFPNDDVEQEREDLKHAMFKLLCGERLHFAPIGDYPQEILDVGTGTGIWPIEMGDQYPSANILGIDLSPIQPDWVPPNVRFQVDDAESEWLHPKNHFDYVHFRHTIMGMRDWRTLFCQALEHLKPGGWIELQEIHHCPHSVQTHSKTPLDHPVAKYWDNVAQGLAVLGVNFFAVADGHLSNMMREVGFTNVTERVIHIPIGPWSKNKVLKRVGLYWRTILLDGLRAISMGPFTRGLNWTREEVELFLINVRQDYLDTALFMYMPFHFIQAQRPLHPHMKDNDSVLSV